MPRGRWQQEIDTIYLICLKAMNSSDRVDDLFVIFNTNQVQIIVMFSFQLRFLIYTNNNLATNKQIKPKKRDLLFYSGWLIGWQYSLKLRILNNNNTVKMIISITQSELHLAVMVFDHKRARLLFTHTKGKYLFGFAHAMKI